MIINQKRFFKGLDFEPQEFEYEFGKQTCYKGPDGGYYRIDHFSTFYVIEFAETEKEAKLNQFEDDDLYDDSLSEEELIAQIQVDLIKYSTEQ